MFDFADGWLKAWLLSGVGALAHELWLLSDVDEPAAELGTSSARTLSAMCAWLNNCK